MNRSTRVFATMLTLYCEHNFDSPFVFTAYVALKEKGIAFTEEVFNLSKGEHRAGLFAERSLSMRVPTLCDGDQWVSDSVAICAYLDEVFLPPDHPKIMGATTAERARVHEVLGWLRSDLRALRAERPAESFLLGHSVGALSEQGIADKKRLLAIAGKLISPEKPFVNERFSIADADLSFMLQRLASNKDPIPAILRDYVERIWSRDSIQAYVNHDR